MSLNLQGGAIKDAATDQNFRAIAQAFPLGNQHLAQPYTRGVTELEWPGENISSNTKEVTHELGEEPVSVVANCVDSGRCVGVTAKSSTTFTLQLQTLQGDKPAEGTKQKVYWLAIA